MPLFRYPWPASRLGREEMAFLFHARESLPGRTPITELLAEAVRARYGHLASNPVVSTEPEKKGSHHARIRTPEHDLEENPSARFAA